jgi:diacylglycerol kinase
MGEVGYGMNTQRGTLLESFQHAFAGSWHAWKTQRNVRIHVAIAIVVVILGLALELQPGQWAVIILTIGFVIVSELFNTVVESLVDLVTAKNHPLAKQAKDVAAGAVLTSAIVAVAVGLLVLGPPLLTRLGWRP